MDVEVVSDGGGLRRVDGWEGDAGEGVGEGNEGVVVG